ncbi:L-xylulose 5-phosphate 3-epimerase [Orenia metallireducens]|uniref:L-ribulose-5-phosphate 3-epimerase n=1 Tax=Orenia metallireducens TaxID=1413210 RepID=A0A285FXW8_9FIRM|nr:L-ribulose-5-phosphate 3-epimerase [Orenia metallireducens]PRX35533.1 L-xylulose 5-phosphate 3-epimerase [Orenia metallireducens]SNY16172.1 L-xylulose 5-phosphate 3-epimerase [Orenia metallireducens]
MHNLDKRPLGLYEKALPNKMDWKTKLESAKEAGFDFIEISVDESDGRLARLDWSQKKRDEIKELIARTGVRISSMCLSAHRRFPFGSEDEKTRERAREIMVKAIELSVDLGIRIIQLAGYDVYYEESNDRTKELFLEGLKEAVTLASRAGVILAIEIMDTQFLGTITRVMKYINELKSPWLKIYPDLGNLSQWAINPEGELELGLEHIVAIHIKDTKPGLFKCVPFGEGTVEFTKLFSKLKKLDYQGAFLIEMWADNNQSYNQKRAIKEVREARIWVEEKMKKGGL